MDTCNEKVARVQIYPLRQQVTSSEAPASSEVGPGPKWRLTYKVSAHSRPPSLQLHYSGQNYWFFCNSVQRLLVLITGIARKRVKLQSCPMPAVHKSNCIMDAWNATFSLTPAPSWRACWPAAAEPYAALGTSYSQKGSCQGGFLFCWCRLGGMGVSLRVFGIVNHL